MYIISARLICGSLIHGVYRTIYVVNTVRFLIVNDTVLIDLGRAPPRIHLPIKEPFIRGSFVRMVNSNQPIFNFGATDQDQVGNQHERVNELASSDQQVRMGFFF